MDSSIGEWFEPLVNGSISDWNRTKLQPWAKEDTERPVVLCRINCIAILLKFLLLNRTLDTTIPSYRTGKSGCIQKRPAGAYYLYNLLSQCYLTP